jgi:hypothetical protein
MSGEGRASIALTRLTFWPWCIAIGVLALSWALTTPPFSAPDESSHYYRGLGLAQGKWVGAPARYTAWGISQRQRQWANMATRWVRVPPHLDPLDMDCFHTRSWISAGCIRGAVAPAEEVKRVTPTGTYPPATTILPGIAALHARTATDAILRARLVHLATCWALLVLAAAVTWRPDAAPWSAGGLPLAVTPMVVFLVGVLNPSGEELVGTAAFGAALLRLSDPDRAPRGTWAALACGGLAVGLSRSIGPVWLVGGLVAALVLFGPRVWEKAVRAAPRAAAISIVILIAALVANRHWEHKYGTRFSGQPIEVLGGFVAELSDYGWQFFQQIGVFQWLDTPLPVRAYALWTGAWAVFLVVAARVADRRERIALALGLVAVAALPFLLFVFLLHPWNWGVQGRHVLPVTILLFLLAGDVIARRHELVPQWARAFGRVLPSFVALFHYLAWWTNARRSAVGTLGPWWFFSSAEWAPPLGWPFWAVFTAGAAALLALPTFTPTADRRWT